MRSRSAILPIATALTLLALVLGCAGISYADPSGTTTGGGFKLGNTKHAPAQKHKGISENNNGPPNPTKSIDCGPRGVDSNKPVSQNHFCQQVQVDCAVTDVGALPAHPPVRTAALLEYIDGRWQFNGSDCNVVPGTVPRPVVTPEMVRAEVIKQVPQVAAGIAPPDGWTLVNLHTVFWVNTPADRPLADVTLLGQRVQMRIHANSVEWSFGDGTSDVSNGPGTPWTKGDQCDDAAGCPGFFTHVYTTTGQVIVTARVQWSGQFSVEGGQWQDIPGTVLGPAASTRLAVQQAVSELGPN